MLKVKIKISNFKLPIYILLPLNKITLKWILKKADINISKDLYKPILTNLRKSKKMMKKLVLLSMESDEFLLTTKY